MRKLGDQIPYLYIPLAPLQQRYRSFYRLICDSRELLQCKLLIVGELRDVDGRVGHGLWNRERSVGMSNGCSGR